MLLEYNAGLMSAFLLVAVTTQFKRRNLQIACGISAILLILYTLGMFTAAAWALYSPGLLLLFVLFAIYTQGEAKMVSTLIAIILFSNFLIY